MFWGTFKCSYIWLAAYKKLFDAFLMSRTYYQIQDFLFYQKGNWVGNNKNQVFLKWYTDSHISELWLQKSQNIRCTVLLFYKSFRMDTQWLFFLLNKYIGFLISFEFLRLGFINLVQWKSYMLQYTVWMKAKNHLPLIHYSAQVQFSEIVMREDMTNLSFDNQKKKNTIWLFLGTYITLFFVIFCNILSNPF